MAPLRVVDLFAGAGGASEGARSAGANVVWAANHWDVAVATHSTNHPLTAHACQDLEQADFTQVPSHDLLWASPACQGHSRARGREQAHHDATRSTAWAVVSCAEVHRPSVVVVENVPEFQEWALFPAWRQALELLGYRLDAHVLDSADYGVPQNRRRLYVTATRFGRLAAPAPIASQVPASSFVDLEAGSWTPVAGKVPATRRRVAAGAAEFGSDPFLVPYYGSGSGLRGRSLERPVGTITTRDRWAVVKQDQGQAVSRFLTVDECRAAMGFPSGYALPPQKKLAKHLLGNAVTPPVAEAWTAAAAAHLANFRVAA